MQTCILFALLLILNPFIGTSQTTDTVYTIQVIDKATNEAIPFANIYIDGIVVAVTDIDGKAIITAKDKNIMPKSDVKVSCPGYSTLEMRPHQLKPGKTGFAYLTTNPIQLDAIEISDYFVPLIDRDDEYKHKEKLPDLNPNPIVAHSEAEINEYEALQNKTWEIPSYLKSNSRDKPDNWYRHLRYYLEKKITYPQRAKIKGVEERLYFKLIFSSEGYLEKIELERGKDIDLVLATAKVLASLPGIEPDNYQKRATKPEVIIPIRFRLN